MGLALAPAALALLLLEDALLLSELEEHERDDAANFSVFPTFWGEALLLSGSTTNSQLSVGP